VAEQLIVLANSAGYRWDALLEPEPAAAGPRPR
jgi:hypothetical protein